MNFTREPIIETILSPKDGCKLCIRNSKIAGAEELFVDAVEVVSFGQAFFFRGQERPKPFLVPASDYEVFEVKETRVVLKNITHERNIKISGGREAFIKPPKEVVPEKVEELEKESEEKDLTTEVVADVKTDKKRDRRRNRRKRMAEERKETGDKPKGSADDSDEEGEEDAPVAEVKVTSAMFTHLLPPPPTLISETLGRLREKEAAAAAAAQALLEEGASVTVPDSAKETPEIPKGEDFFN
ncbi:MAG: hypothetical protein V4489_03535 [Chlamydiota bacterium]